MQPHGTAIVKVALYRPALLSQAVVADLPLLLNLGAWLGAATMPLIARRWDGVQSACTARSATVSRGLLPCDEWKMLVYLLNICRRDIRTTSLYGFRWKSDLGLGGLQNLVSFTRACHAAVLTAH